MLPNSGLWLHSVQPEEVVALRGILQPPPPSQQHQSKQFHPQQQQHHQLAVNGAQRNGGPSSSTLDGNRRPPFAAANPPTSAPTVSMVSAVAPAHVVVLDADAKVAYFQSLLAASSPLPLGSDTTNNAGNTAPPNSQSQHLNQTPKQQHTADNLHRSRHRAFEDGHRGRPREQELNYSYSIHQQPPLPAPTFGESSAQTASPSGAARLLRQHQQNIVGMRAAAMQREALDDLKKKGTLSLSHYSTSNKSHAKPHPAVIRDPRSLLDLTAVEDFALIRGGVVNSSSTTPVAMLTAAAATTRTVASCVNAAEEERRRYRAKILAGGVSPDNNNKDYNTEEEYEGVGSDSSKRRRRGPSPQSWAAVSAAAAGTMPFLPSPVGVYSADGGDVPNNQHAGHNDHRRYEYDPFEQKRLEAIAIAAANAVLNNRKLNVTVADSSSSSSNNKKKNGDEKVGGGDGGAAMGVFRYKSDWTSHREQERARLIQAQRLQMRSRMAPETAAMVLAQIQDETFDRDCLLELEHDEWRRLMVLASDDCEEQLAKIRVRERTALLHGEVEARVFIKGEQEVSFVHLTDFLRRLEAYQWPFSLLYAKEAQARDTITVIEARYRDDLMSSLQLAELAADTVLDTLRKAKLAAQGKVVSMTDYRLIHVIKAKAAMDGARASMLKEEKRLDDEWRAVEKHISPVRGGKEEEGLNQSRHAAASFSDAANASASFAAAPVLIGTTDGYGDADATRLPTLRYSKEIAAKLASSSTNPHHQQQEQQQLQNNSKAKKPFSISSTSSRFSLDRFEKQLRLDSNRKEKQSQAGGEATGGDSRGGFGISNVEKEDNAATNLRSVFGNATDGEREEKKEDAAHAYAAEKLSEILLSNRGLLTSRRNANDTKDDTVSNVKYPTDVAQSLLEERLQYEEARRNAYFINTEEKAAKAPMVSAEEPYQSLPTADSVPLDSFYTSTSAIPSTPHPINNNRAVVTVSSETRAAANLAAQMQMQMAMLKTAMEGEEEEEGEANTLLRHQAAEDDHRRDDEAKYQREHQLYHHHHHHNHQQDDGSLGEEDHEERSAHHQGFSGVHCDPLANAPLFAHTNKKGRGDVESLRGLREGEGGRGVGEFYSYPKAHASLPSEQRHQMLKETEKENLLPSTPPPPPPLAPETREGSAEGDATEKATAASAAVGAAPPPPPPPSSSSVPSSSASPRIQRAATPLLDIRDTTDAMHCVYSSAASAAPSFLQRKKDDEDDYNNALSSTQPPSNPTATPHTAIDDGRTLITTPRIHLAGGGNGGGGMARGGSGGGSDAVNLSSSLISRGRDLPVSPIRIRSSPPTSRLADGHVDAGAEKENIHSAERYSNPHTLITNTAPPALLPPAAAQQQPLLLRNDAHPTRSPATGTRYSHTNNSTSTDNSTMNVSAYAKAIHTVALNYRNDAAAQERSLQRKFGGGGGGGGAVSASSSRHASPSIRGSSGGGGRVGERVGSRSSQSSSRSHSANNANTNTNNVSSAARDSGDRSGRIGGGGGGERGLGSLRSLAYGHHDYNMADDAGGTTLARPPPPTTSIATTSTVSTAAPTPKTTTATTTTPSVAAVSSSRGVGPSSITVIDGVRVFSSPYKPQQANFEEEEDVAAAGSTTLDAYASMFGSSSRANSVAGNVEAGDQHNTFAASPPFSSSPSPSLAPPRNNSNNGGHGNTNAYVNAFDPRATFGRKGATAPLTAGGGGVSSRDLAMIANQNVFPPSPYFYTTSPAATATDDGQERDDTATAATKEKEQHSDTWWRREY